MRNDLVDDALDDILDALEHATEPLHERIKALEAEIAALKAHDASDIKGRVAALEHALGLGGDRR